MSAYTTRKITESKARELLVQHYAQMAAKAATMDMYELERQLDGNISDTGGYLLINFDVISDSEYRDADIT